MWSYFGGKTNIVDYYPAPEHDKIIEPFAGSARYALKYFEKDVLLVDRYKVIIDMWLWLQKCSVYDIDRLPHYFNPNQPLSDFIFDCDEAKNLLGFLIGFGMERPRKNASAARMTLRPNHVNFSLNRIRDNLFKIRRVKLGSYNDVQNEKATWFIDPPYKNGGESYVFSNKHIDYSDLSSYCKERQGQVIVCENSKAEWLPFQPFKTQKTKTRNTSI